MEKYMIICSELIKILEAFAPLSLAESWDNCGLLIGDPKQQISCILVTLDVTMTVAQEAVQNGAQFIVSHHPVIFKAMSSIRTDTSNGALIHYLIQNNISVYAAHTNLDSAEGGLNDFVASQMGMSALSVLMPLPNDSNAGLGRIGDIQQPISVEALARNVKASLHAKNVRVIGELSKMVQKIAFVSGGGADYILQAKQKGADVYITGDTRHHHLLQAAQLDLVLIDAGHYDTEKQVRDLLQNFLSEKLSRQGVQVLQSNVERNLSITI
ncbi:MAG: Nif3-like dinuclear metal center hexameric protein [Hyphomonadaceae bacterium]|nr:Nif3-like dinuclear metal center hexameric protein [Clostridia bacterium]